MEKRLVNDKGETLECFLKKYKQSEYERPSLSVDAIVFRDRKLTFKIALIKRNNHPYIDCWALPGGFVEPEESAESAIYRELKEEIGIDVYGNKLRYLALRSEPHRDPRCWVVSQPFAIRDSAGTDISAGDDARECRWFEIHKGFNGELFLISDTVVLRNEDLAFDHFEIIKEWYGGYIQPYNKLI